ncbi:DNA-binding protein [Bacillus phage vB_BceH_LY2]|nr:DNA-binding protein [Bacillus phage vB_BceH_LY2]
MYNRLNFEDVKEYIEKYNYRLLSDTYINNREKLDIECDRGHKYRGNFNHFKNNKRCPVCSSSKGERLIYNILKRILPNNIKWIHQESRNIEGINVKYDFFIEHSKNLYIEHQGEFHFKETNLTNSADLKRRKELDKLKKDFVISNNDYIFYTFYTQSNKEIYTTIKNALEDINIPSTSMTDEEIKEASNHSFNTYNLKDVSKYYETNTAIETAKKFNISVYTVYRSFNYINNKPKQEVSRHTDDAIATYYLNHNLSETVSFCGLDKSLIQRIFKEKYKHSKTDYVRLQKNKDIANFFVNNTLEDTETKFGVSKWVIDKSMKEVFGVNKQDYIRSKLQKEVALYYLTHTKEETKNKFNVSDYSLQSFFREVYGVNKKQHLTNTCEQH